MIRLIAAVISSSVADGVSLYLPFFAAIFRQVNVLFSSRQEPLMARLYLWHNLPRTILRSLVKPSFSQSFNRNLNYHCNSRELSTALIMSLSQVGPVPDPLSPGLGPPPGITPCFYEPYTLAPYNTVEIIVCVGVITVLLVGRVYTKTALIKHLSWEDCM